MQVILVGDAASGKSTCLHFLEERGYAVVKEDGWMTIPREIEENKFLSNLWFCRYFAVRDKPTWCEPVIRERCLHFQYPFSRAQKVAGKITEEQYLVICQTLDSMLGDFPLHNTLVVQFVTDNAVLRSRLGERGRCASGVQELYWEHLRTYTKEFFSSHCPFISLDTTGRSKQEMFRDILDILDSRHFLINNRRYTFPDVY